MYMTNKKWKLSTSRICQQGSSRGKLYMRWSMIPSKLYAYSSTTCTDQPKVAKNMISSFLSKIKTFVTLNGLKFSVAFKGISKEYHIN